MPDEKSRKLSKKSIDTLLTKGVIDHVIWDSVLPNFGVRVARLRNENLSYSVPQCAGQTAALYLWALWAYDSRLFLDFLKQLLARDSKHL